MDAVKELRGSALIYCRVSTARQEEDGTSLKSQERECRRHAAELGYDVAGVFHEVYSGHEVLDRPVLNQVRELVKTRTYQAVVVYAIDRLTRRQGLTPVLLYEWERYGVELVSVTDPLDKTPQGRFMLSAKEFIAEVEREKIRERSVRGRRARLQSGKLHNAGHELYGYRRDKEAGRRHVYDPEAAVVRQIFRWIAVEGLSLYEVTHRLNSQGVPAPSVGKVAYSDPDRRPMWGKSTLRRILGEPCYKGETIGWRWSGQLAGTHDAADEIRLPEGTTPAIVDARTWDDAQQRLEANRGAPPRPDGRPYLLRRMVYCAVCGRRMRGDVQNGLRIYRCSSRETPAGPCGAKGVPAEDTFRHTDQPRGKDGRCLPITPEMRAQGATLPGIDRAVWEQVAERLNDPRLIAQEVERLRAAGPDPSLQEDLDGARRAIAKLDRQQERLVSLYAAADDDMPLEVVRQQMAAVGRERDQWQARVDQLQGRLAKEQATVEQLEALGAYCERVAQNLERFDFEQRRFALETLGVYVIANGREWEWHSETLVPTVTGREYTTCSSRDRRGVERPCWPAPCPPSSPPCRLTRPSKPPRSTL